MNAEQLFIEIQNGSILKYKAACSKNRIYQLSYPRGRFIMSSNQTKTRQGLVDRTALNIIENILNDSVEYELTTV